MIREARTMDASAVGTILHGFVQTTAWMPKLHSAAETLAYADLMIGRRWVYVMQQEGAITGFLAADGSFIHALYVRDDAQGAGVGSALLRDAMARNPRLELFTFQANTGAQRFYTRHGFVEAGRSDGAENDENLPDIRYVWQATKDMHA